MLGVAGQPQAVLVLGLYKNQYRFVRCVSVSCRMQVQARQAAAVRGDLGQDGASSRYSQFFYLL